MFKGTQDWYMKTISDRLMTKGGIVVRSEVFFFAFCLYGPTLAGGNLVIFGIQGRKVKS